MVRKLHASTDGLGRPVGPGFGSDFSFGFRSEADQLIALNWTGDAVESVLRLRALGEISEHAQVDTLMRLALLLVERPHFLEALLDVGLTQALDTGKIDQ